MAEKSSKYPDKKWVRGALRWATPRIKHKMIDAYIVGSEAKGTAKPDRDLDIAIIIAPVRGITSLKFSERYHQCKQYPLTYNDRTVDLQFFYPDDQELSTYSKIDLT